MLADNRPIVAWFFDTKGWAFSKIAQELIARLPMFRHMRVYKDISGHVSLTRIRYIADIIVIFHPYDMRLFDETDSVVCRMDSYRGLERCNLV